ncbi:MAG: L,D-transpeptidase family protein [Myxococcota bacterium]
MAKGTHSREALVGVGMAGLMLGSLSAAIVEAPSKPGEAAAKTAPSGPRGSADAGSRARVRDEPDPLEAVVDALEAAHARVHEAPAGGDADAVPEPLVEAIEEDDWLVSLRLDLHRRAGAGALVDAGGATPAARALVDLLERIDRHGLDPADYGMPDLAEDLAAFEDDLDAPDVTPPAEAGAAGSAMVAILRAPHFDRDRTLRRLRDAGGAPRPGQVEAVADALVAVERGPAALARAAALEARLGRALVRLVLDMRYVKETGPFEITWNERNLANDEEVRGDLLDLAAGVVAAPDPEAALVGLNPPHPQYERMLEVYAHYREVADSGCHEVLPEEWRLEPGDEGPEVERLQERMACEGYYKGDVDGRYGDALLEAVKDYQRHHELDPDGYVWEGTLRSMNVSMERRAEQVALTLQRMRESHVGELGDYYLRINLPAFELQVVEDGEIIRRQRIIVGANRLDDDKVKLVQGHINRTKLMTTRLHTVVIYPYWYVPERVAQGEIKKKLEDNPDYLEEKHIIQQEMPGGGEVLVQQGGEQNPLGDVKFLLEESEAIYLHDTDKPDLFEHRRRDFSHGCIRVQGAVELAKWLLLKDGKAGHRVKRSFTKEVVRHGYSLNEPIPLVTEYMTVDVMEDGGPIFLTDIYGYDRAYRRGDLPPQVTARWGSGDLRPHWVPYVPEEVVQEWRDEGLHAPHDYDPEEWQGDGAEDAASEDAEDSDAPAEE